MDSDEIERTRTELIDPFLSVLVCACPCPCTGVRLLVYPPQDIDRIRGLIPHGKRVGERCWRVRIVLQSSHGPTLEWCSRLSGKAKKPWTLLFADHGLNGQIVDETNQVFTPQGRGCRAAHSPSLCNPNHAPRDLTPMGLCLHSWSQQVRNNQACRLGSTLPANASARE